MGVERNGAGGGRLDSFARALAGGGMSRRETLRAAMIAVGGTALSSPMWGLTDVAQAAGRTTRKCPAGHAACGARCCPVHETCVRPKPTRLVPHPKPRCDCVAPRKLCAAGCVNLHNDPLHCGSCKHRCPVPKGGKATCVNGVCKSHCSVAGQTVCSGTCVNVHTDAHNCGKCGHACASGMMCSNGACVENCPTGQTACGTSCVNLQTDAGHCGGCGTSCAASAAGGVCLSGQCGCSLDTDCPTGKFCSGNTCVDDVSAGQNCTRDGECESGHCVGGICCDGPCSGPCLTCAGGTCGSVALGTTCGANQVCDGSGNCKAAQGATCSFDTDCATGHCVTDDSNLGAKICCSSPCSASSQGSCGTDGNCKHDGSGCALYLTGTTCGSATCVDNPGGSMATSAPSCDGNGTCAMGTQTSCGNYKCNGTNCRTTCSFDNDCISSAFCQASSCVPKQGGGTTCVSGNNCTSSNCLGGRCCSPGVTCITGGTCGAMACDVSGNCVYPAAGTGCGSGQTCDGAGHCTM